MAMRLSPPSSKKFDSLPTGPASSSSSHTDATARSASVSGSDREDADGAASGAMPAKAFRSTFPFALKVLALPQNQPNAPLYPAGGAPGSRPGALPHFGRPRYLGPPPRARSTAG